MFLEILFLNCKNINEFLLLELQNVAGNFILAFRELTLQVQNACLDASLQLQVVVI